MIFVGDGALLWRAVRHARADGHPVDLVCHGPRTTPPPGFDPGSAREVRSGADLDALAGELAERCTDGLLWSIDNPFLFREKVLASGLRLLNVHGGPLPSYRGLPPVTAAYAVLHGETSFAATLHEIDAGIDTGPVLAEARFRVDPDAVLEDVLSDLVEAAHRAFTENLGAVVDGTAGPARRPEGEPGYYGLAEGLALAGMRDHPRYDQATDLGMFADYYPDAATAWGR